MSKIIFICMLLAGAANASGIRLHEQNTVHIFEITRASVSPVGVQIFVTGDKLACLVDSNFLKSTGASGYEVMKDLTDRQDRLVECSQGVAKEIKSVPHLKISGI